MVYRKNPKPYEKMTKAELIEEVKMEAENHIKMDKLADRRSIKLDELTERFKAKDADIRELEQQLARALGYIDRIKDCETVTAFKPPKAVEAVTRPLGPAVSAYEDSNFYV